MKKKRQKKSETLTLALLLVLVLVITITIIITSLDKIIKNDEKISEEQIQIEIQKQQKETFKETEKTVVISKLEEMGERDRIEYYFSQFITEIENKNYQKAYDMLYDDFKINYFPSIDDFEEYAKKTFPRMIAVEHTNFDRSGNVYILFIKMSDSLSGNKTDAKEMKFVVREDGINEFVMSFSVI